jgi:hypothetical protein
VIVVVVKGVGVITDFVLAVLALDSLFELVRLALAMLVLALLMLTELVLITESAPKVFVLTAVILLGGPVLVDVTLVVFTSAPFKEAV